MIETEEVGMDMTHLSRAAAELRALAGEARHAAAVATATRDVRWQSVAAGAYRGALRREAELARRCGDLLEAAAGALAAHARAVGDLPVVGRVLPGRGR